MPVLKQIKTIINGVVVVIDVPAGQVLTSIMDLPDVSGTPVNGYILKYSSSLGKWVVSADNTVTAATQAQVNSGTITNLYVSPATSKMVQNSSIPTTLVAGQSYYATLAANLGIVALTALSAGKFSEWHFVAIEGSVPYTITFPASYSIKWAAPLPTFAANKIYEFSIIKVGTNYLGCWVVY
jgi:hypothetical protein